MSPAVDRPPLGRRAARLLLEHGIEHAPLARAVWRGAMRPLLLRLKPDLVLAALGHDEEFESSLFVRLLSRGDTVIDVGANVGYYTLLAARAVGPQGTVIAFEPSSANLARLVQQVRAFGYANVIVEPQAVADSCGEVQLYLSPRSGGDHRIFDPGEARATTAVPVTTLDAYLRQRGTPRVDVIKMDIQGAELAAARGMDGLLRSAERLILFTEFWPFGLAQAGASAAAYLDLLASSGFALYEVREAAHTVEPVEPTGLLARYPAQRDVYTNLVCLKGRPLAELEAAARAVGA